MERAGDLFVLPSSLLKKHAMLKDKHWEPQPIWYGETVVIMATGPSLTTDDCEQVFIHRHALRTIVVNDAYKLYPYADLLYACDKLWWEHHQGVPTFLGRKVSMQPVSAYDSIRYVENAGNHGISTRPGYINNGRNSTYQALNLAVQLGSKRIILLGLDLKDAPDGKKHFFGDHPKLLNRSRPEDYKVFRDHFTAGAEQLERLGVKVYNASPDSALDCFEKKTLEELL